MQELTGLTGFDWLLVLQVGLALVLCLEARRRDVVGTRIAGWLLVPVLTGLALFVAVVALYSDELQQLRGNLGDRAPGLVALAGVLITAVAFGDLLVVRLTGIAGWLLRLLGERPLRADGALVLGVALPAAVAFALAPQADERLVSGLELARLEAGGGATVAASYPLPGHPLDLALQTQSSGYMTFGEGWIGRIELPAAGDEGGEPEVIRVVEGLEYPRGLALLGDTLYVVELGDLPCEPAFPSCKGGDVEGLSVEETEREMLRTSRARVLAFDVGADGSLSGKRTILADLPVANTDHAVNDLVVGPGGRLYASVGNLDRLHSTPGLESDLSRPNADLLGTVVSFRRDGSDLRVVARGIRNVYGLAFDGDGRLYGVDNDGTTQTGWRREELLEIRPGAEFGYPQDGTFAPAARPRDPPLWAVPGVGSGGIAWLPGEGGGRLVTGACSTVDQVVLTAEAGAVQVKAPADVTRLLELPGCVTTIQPAGDLLALGVFAFEGDSRLVLLRPGR